MFGGGTGVPGDDSIDCEEEEREEDRGEREEDRGEREEDRGERGVLSITLILLILLLILILIITLAAWKKTLHGIQLGSPMVYRVNNILTR